MQIENGGDDPAVNHLLIEALRVTVRFQVNNANAKPVLAALEASKKAEAARS
jgi:hypothetical protein